MNICTQICIFALHLYIQIYSYEYMRTNIHLYIQIYPYEYMHTDM